MAKIILEGWREGLQKISLTKLQVEMLGLSLRESKRNVDSLLNDSQVVIGIDNLDLANDFLEKAYQIGVDCKLLLNQPPY